MTLLSFIGLFFILFVQWVISLFNPPEESPIPQFIGGPSDGHLCEAVLPVMITIVEHTERKDDRTITLKRKHKYLFDGKNYIYSGCTQDYLEWSFCDGKE